jgi:hypothetical protein
MVSLSVKMTPRRTMTQDDTVRVTLRLPKDLHAELVDAAEIMECSLNKQIVRWLEAGRDDDLWNRLIGIRSEKWLQVIEDMQKEHEARYTEAKRRIIAVGATKNVKKGAA